MEANLSFLTNTGVAAVLQFPCFFFFSTMASIMYRYAEHNELRGLLPKPYPGRKNNKMRMEREKKAPSSCYLDGSCITAREGRNH